MPNWSNYDQAAWVTSGGARRAGGRHGGAASVTQRLSDLRLSLCAVAWISKAKEELKQSINKYLVRIGRNKDSWKPRVSQQGMFTLTHWFLAWRPWPSHGGLWNQFSGSLPTFVDKSGQNRKYQGNTFITLWNFCFGSKMFFFVGAPAKNVWEPLPE